MVVVFLDGVDGAGKTTLLHQLVARLRDRRTVVTPPLWRYLPSIAGPEDFAGWVTTTGPARVAVELLTAQRNRIAAIPPGTHDTDDVTVLVDRGPKTVEASSRAHLGLVGGSAATEVQHCVAELRETVGQLADALPCLSVELVVESYGQIVERLSDDERSDSVYLRYLHSFLDQFRAMGGIDGIVRLALAATDTLDRNAAAATRAIAAHAAAERC